MIWVVETEDFCSRVAKPMLSPPGCAEIWRETANSSGDITGQMYPGESVLFVWESLLETS